jgi:K+-sensing histidine kinase KdpD
MHAPEHEHQKDLIQYVLSELLSNALTHAQRHGFRGRARVWTTAQYYPSHDKVRLAVVDTGCGLLATLRGHPELETETHFAAISAALQPRVSCNRNLGVRQDTVNQGVGLTTVHRIVDQSLGDMLVLTGDAYQRQRGGAVLRDGAAWQGVVTAVEMRREALRGLRVAALLPLGDAVSPELRFE